VQLTSAIRAPSAMGNRMDTAVDLGITAPMMVRGQRDVVNSAVGKPLKATLTPAT